MNFIKYVIAVGSLLFLTNIYAQQQPNHMFYRYTMNAINPAYAGADGVSRLTANYRNQWVNVDDAPRTQTFFFDTSLGEKVGLGISVVNDKVFVESNTSFMLDFSYKLELNYTTNLFLGLKAGGSSYNFDRQGLANLAFPTDPALGNLETGIRPNVGIGVYLVHEKYFVSLSSPQLLLNERIDLQNGRVTAANEKAHFYLSGGYDFDISTDWEFRPSTMIRYVGGAPIAVDITAAFRYLEMLELAGMYRTSGGWGGMLLFNLKDWIDIGYAYEGSSREVLNNVSDGTHEILLRFTFPKLK